MSLIEAIIVFISAICLIFLYKKVAITKGIFAHISARSLHANVVVRGGGIVFGILFSLMMYFYLLKENVQVWQTISFGLSMRSVFRDTLI